MQYQWKWQKVDKPGVWAWGGLDRAVPPAGIRNILLVQEWEVDDPMRHEGWYQWLGPIPDIAPPEPELRLPEDLSAEITTTNTKQWHDVWIVRDDQTTAIRVIHPDKPTAIRAAQAAVDELKKGTP